MPKKPKVAVIGVTGFTGALAANLLYGHPQFDLVTITARSELDRRLDEVYPYYRVPLEIEELDLGEYADLDAAVIAYPHGAAASTVAALRDGGVRVVDLSADFRLDDLALYESWYGKHGAPDLFGKAAYGLPEFYREQIVAADLVANPGCYPTATLLALAPLVRAGLIEDVVVDAKSGVSGVGRKANETTHFVSIDENTYAYGVAGHRHSPEIDQELAKQGAAVHATFVPHLLPLDQGELVSCYVKSSKELTDLELIDLYQTAYANEPFVELATKPPGVRDVRATNFCRVYTNVEERSGRLLIFAAIDNLWKGASSQAVQNLNLMFGFEEGLGIS